MRWWIRTVALSLALACQPDLAIAQGVVGQITDESGTPLAAALVTLRSVVGEVAAWGLSGDDGWYELMATDSGTYQLTVESAGFASLSLPAVHLTEGITTAVRFELPIEPVPLDPITVETERRSRLEVELDRYGLSATDLENRIITREDLAARQNATDVGVAIEWKRINGARVIRTENFTMGGTPVLCVTQLRGKRGNGKDRCVLTVLNGTVIAIDAAAMIPPDQIEGMVLLTPIEATRLFGTVAGGGALLMFTRSGPGR